MRRWSLWLFIISLALRLLSIGVDLLWFDEAFTWAVIKLPFPNMLQALAGDTHPPLWYLIEWLAVHVLGPSEMALRSPAALFGSGAVVMLYWLVQHLSGESAARWSSGLMSIMPAQLFYSQEARMYGLLTFLVLFAALSIQKRQWLRLGISLALIMFTQSAGILYVGLLSAWSLWVTGGRVWRYLVIAALGYLPQAFVTLSQVSNVADIFFIPDPANIGAAIYSLHYSTFFVRIPEPFKLHSAILTMASTIITLLALRNSTRKVWPLLALAFLPPIGLFLLSKFWQPMMVDRTLIPAGAALVGLWGTALSKLPGKSLKPLAAVGLPMLILAVATYYTDPSEQRKRTDETMDLIRTNWQAGDVIYHGQLDSLIRYEYYVPELPSFSMPPQAGMTQGELSEQSQVAMGIADRRADLKQVRSLGYRRAWFVYEQNLVISQYAIDFKDTALRSFHVLQSWVIATNRIYRLDLYLLEL